MYSESAQNHEIKKISQLSLFFFFIITDENMNFAKIQYLESSAFYLKRKNECLYVWEALTLNTITTVITGMVNT
jgi:hypothetical protein